MASESAMPGVKSKASKRFRSEAFWVKLLNVSLMLRVSSRDMFLARAKPRHLRERR
jgi:hypothetical protein